MPTAGVVWDTLTGSVLHIAVDRLLEPKNTSVILATLNRAAISLGSKVKIGHDFRTGLRITCNAAKTSAHGSS